jgi:hypothetical protein
MDRLQIHKCGEWVKQTMDEAKSSLVVQKATANPKIVLYGVAAICLVTWLSIRAVQLLRNRRIDTPITPLLEKGTSSIFKAPPRKPGGQIPSRDLEIDC